MQVQFENRDIEETLDLRYVKDNKTEKARKKEMTAYQQEYN